MIHEVKEIFKQARLNQEKGLKSVLATVVHLDGSSYRKPGVRMLIAEDSSTVGAVSGGCVEKEIILRAASVFKENRAKIITYDGRYRLGCEGILYILIEPFYVSDNLNDAFQQNYQNRKSVHISCSFKKEDEAQGNFGSEITIHQKKFTFSENYHTQQSKDSVLFEQNLSPCFRLLIIGGEHDAVKLCNIASNLGWQVDVVTSAKEQKQLTDFPGANSLQGAEPETFKFNEVENNTAVVIMNHSFVRDLKYVIELSKHKANYIGILGAPKRREQLFNELFNYMPEISDSFLESIYTPAGLHIGAKTPEEIAISIIAEILSVFRNKEPFYLRELNGKIHSNS